MLDGGDRESAGVSRSTARLSVVFVPIDNSSRSCSHAVTARTYGQAMAEGLPQFATSERSLDERSLNEPTGAVSTGLDPGTLRVLNRCRVGIGFGVLILGGAVALGGWVAGAQVLTDLVPGLNSMKFNAAVCLAALGTGLALTDGTPNLRRAGKAAVAFALALALLTLSEYAFHWNLGIDQLFVPDLRTPAEKHPGRPALAAAVTMAMLAVALLCTHRPRLRVLKTFSAAGSALISWAALNEYVFGVDALRAVPLFGEVPLHTAVGTLLLALGALSAPPVSWPIPTVLAKSTGAVICRWLLPPAIIAPPLIGWVLSRFPAGGAEHLVMFRWALYSAISSLGSVWLILLLAQRITLVDVERATATQLSLRDALTGLANRRSFDAFLLECFGLARRHQRSLSLMMLDIDRFKSYNDQYGHPAGDRLLRALGGLLSSLARQTDLVARVGGEEFAVVLPETDLAGARAIAERARAGVERSPQYGRRVTVSIGIAEVHAETTDCSMIVQEADTGLYRAKRAGRNRVMTAREESADVNLSL
jgi:diguanylate cyclase (GGDEF)-like protein